MEQPAKPPPEILNLVKYLRSSQSGIKNRSGIHSGKRVEYFKGKGAVKALLKDSYKKLQNVPKVSNAEEASELLQKVLPHALFLRVERATNESALSPRNSPKILTVLPTQHFDENGYYVWFYEGSQLWTLLGGIGLITIVFAGVMFPLWPLVLRDGVWYIAVAILSLFGLLMIISVVRLVLFLITMIILPPGIWIFPNLFEDVGFFESFVPFYGWEVPKKKEKVVEYEDDAGENDIGEADKNKDLRATIQDAEEDEKDLEDKKED